MTARSRRAQRGVALLIVIVSIALLTVTATDFAFNSRVDLQLAANHRDDIRAYFLARSGIGLSRLVLKFQRQLDATPMPNLSGMLQNLIPGAGGGAGAATPPAQSMNLQIWRMVRVDCAMLQGLVPEVDPRERPSQPVRTRATGSDFDKDFPEIASRQAQRSFGGFEGCFNAKISDEEEKLNLTRLDSGALQAPPVVIGLLDLLSDKRFEFLFEREDSNRVKVTPQDVIINLKDWMDEDDVQSSLNVAGALNGQQIFLNGFSDEKYGYDNYTPRYQPKNARFDSVDELYMVHGINDAFMAAFRDRVTVYADVNARLNINTDDSMMLYMAIRAVADPARPDPRLNDPVFVDRLIQQVRAARMFSYLGTSVQDFLNVVQAAGVPINESIRNNVANNPRVSDKSTTYRIESVGEAGSVQKKITAVVRLEEGLGRLLYWREE